MKPAKFTRPTPRAVATQETPADLVNDLMTAVRNGFYGEDPEAWFAQQHFIKRNVILWPASFVIRKGFTMAPERYKAALLEVFQGIKQHGQTGAVKFWPGYLMKCVQDHFKIHWEEYYTESKSIIAKVDQALFAASRATEAQRGPDQVQSLASAHAVLVANKRRKKVVPETSLELPLFGSCKAGERTMHEPCKPVNSSSNR